MDFLLLGAGLTEDLDIDYPLGHFIFP